MIKNKVEGIKVPNPKEFNPNNNPALIFIALSDNKARITKKVLVFKRIFEIAI